MITEYTKAAKLPALWDEIFAAHSYLSKGHLAMLESCNPCSQKYVIINNRSAFVVYELKLNIFSYASRSFNLKVSIIGIPCSVSKEGYEVKNEDIKELEGYIKKEKKACIILNADDSFLSSKLITGETLPSCILHIAWDSFEEYMGCLRSHYRYRFNKALQKGEKVVIRKLDDNRLFDEKMYALYEAVYEKSNYKLEKLSIDFFRKMPADVYGFYVEGEARAFVQLSENDKELLFVFGGIDYSLNHQYDLYINMMIFILRYGIDNKYASIDMGQTAEAAKMKFGCGLQKKYMHIYHPSAIVRQLISVFARQLSYKIPEMQFNLFRR